MHWKTLPATKIAFYALYFSSLNIGCISRANNNCPILRYDLLSKETDLLLLHEKVSLHEAGIFLLV